MEGRKRERNVTTRVVAERVEILWGLRKQSTEG